jgi:hypothetical protein
MTSNNDAGRRDGGFSLVELMIAMVATLVITGAVVQLVGAGKGAFRREPELVDRQQNVRMAMALITEDVRAAGLGLPSFAQSFTDGLDALGPNGPTGAKTDEIEILTMSACPTLDVCSSTGTTVTTWESLPQCYGFPTLVALWNQQDTGIFWAEAPGSGGGTNSCDASGGTTGSTGGGNSGGQGNQNNNKGGDGGSTDPGTTTTTTTTSTDSTSSGSTADKNGHTVIPHGKDRFHNPPGGPGFDPEKMGIISVMRYRVVVDAEGMPNLWRSAFGGSDVNGQSSWQLVARGIEDLQVSYLTGGGWSDTPGIVTCGANCAAPTDTEFGRIVRQVRIVLTSRTAATNLQGATASATVSAVRGNLQSEIAPRAALMALNSSNGAARWY